MQTHIESLDRRTHPFALPHTPTLSPAHTAPAHALILSVGCAGGVARQGASPGRLLAAAAATIDTTTTGSSDSSTTTAAVAPRFISLSPCPMHHTHQPFFVVVPPPRARIPPPPGRTLTKTGCMCVHPSARARGFCWSEAGHWCWPPPRAGGGICNALQTHTACRPPCGPGSGGPSCLKPHAVNARAPAGCSCAAQY